MTTNHDLGPLERKILKIIWSKNRASVQEVQSELNRQKSKHLAYTTVMTILTRLVEKQILTREKDGRCFYYSTVENKQNFMHGMARKTLLSFVNRFGDEALAAFMDEAQKLSKNEAEMVLKKLENK